MRKPKLIYGKEYWVLYRGNSPRKAVYSEESLGEHYWGHKNYFISERACILGGIANCEYLSGFDVCFGGSISSQRGFLENRLREIDKPNNSIS